MAATDRNILNLNGNSSCCETSGTDTPNASLDTILEMVDLCWNPDDPNFNLCGTSASLKITGIINEVDNTIGDSRVRLNVVKTFTPANVLTDTLTMSYTLPNGQPVIVNNPVNNIQILDLYDTSNFTDLQSEGRSITGVSFSNISANVKRIKISGTLLIADLDTIGGTFFLLRKLQSAVGGLPFNSKEIVFYKQACSSFVQGNNFVTFDYNTAYVTLNKEYMFWIDQTVQKINPNFLPNNQSGTTWEQKVRYNLQPIVPPVEYVRTITFNNACAPKVIRKRVTLKNARAIFSQAGLVNRLIELNIVDF